MKSIALIGYGYWGKNLMRNIVQSKLWESVFLFELDESKKKICSETFPRVIINHTFEDILLNKNIEAIVIATPPHTQYEIAKKGLENNKHILCEKPFTTSYKHGKELVDIAKSNKLKIMVDYTFLYTGAVEKIKEITDKGGLGKLLYIDSTRINLGIFQSNINVLWDLACHDLSIINHIIDSKLISVQSTGISHTPNGIENIAYLTLKYKDNLIAHINCSWTSPVKIRQMLFGGDKKMIVYNDIEPTDKIKIYDAGFEVKTENDKNKLLIDYRMGDVYSPKLDNAEALSKMIKDFYLAITINQKPKANTELALDVLEILEAAQESISAQGKQIFIDG